MRAHVSVFLACIAAACGDHAGPARPSTPVPLATGAYRLTLFMAATGDRSCTGAGCTAPSMCASTGGVQADGIFIPVDVRVERTGDDVAVHPLDPSSTFRMNLEVNGFAVVGTAAGELHAGALVVAVDGRAPRDLAAVAGIATIGHASGTLEGAIMFAGSGCSNDAHRWYLDPPLRF